VEELISQMEYGRLSYIRWPVTGLPLVADFATTSTGAGSLGNTRFCHGRLGYVFKSAGATTEAGF
jgi:hypothetical protein